jgi:hypothetical protein
MLSHRERTATRARCKVAMDILGISYLLESICVDTDATFLQEDEVTEHKWHDFSFCLPDGCLFS